MSKSREICITKKLRDEKFNKGFLWCNTCKHFLPKKKFYKQINYRLGYSYKCRECARAIQRTYKNGLADDVRKERDRRFTSTNRPLRKKRKRTLIRLAGKHCQRCGYKEFQAGLCFHHVNPDEKIPGVPIKYNSLEKAKEEIDKCILLCANCHISYHAREWSAKFTKRDGLGWTVKQGTEILYDE